MKKSRLTDSRIIAILKQAGAIGKMQKARSLSGLLNVAPPAGLEPATYGLTVRRSTD